VAIGDWTVTARDSVWGVALGSATVDVVAGPNAVTIDTQALEMGTVRFEVLAGGVPAPGLRVWLGGTSGNTGPDGVVELQAPAGEHYYHVSTGHPLYETLAYDLVDVEAG